MREQRGERRGSEDIEEGTDVKGNEILESYSLSHSEAPDSMTQS